MYHDVTANARVLLEFIGSLAGVSFDLTRPKRPFFQFSTEKYKIFQNNANFDKILLYSKMFASNRAVSTVDAGAEAWYDIPKKEAAEHGRRPVDYRLYPDRKSVV